MAAHGVANLHMQVFDAGYLSEDVRSYSAGDEAPSGASWGTFSNHAHECNAGRHVRLVHDDLVVTEGAR